MEGGFSLGDGAPPKSRRTSPSSPNRGVGYVTVAHLFWRQVATNAPALPFLPDSTYNALFPQPQGEA